MNDPKRLIEEVGGFEAEVLRAGRKDALSERSALSITAALGVAPLAAAATSTLATGAKAATAKSAFAIGGVSAAGALAIWAGVSLLSGPAPVGEAQRQREADKPVPIAVAAREAEPIAPQQAKEVAEPARPKAPARSVRPPVISDADTLPRELEMIDSARSALARGDASLALSLLDAYAARFPKPHLRAESAVLRIEALVARGQGAAATRLGKEFLKREPNGPYARRVRSLLERAGER